MVAKFLILSAFVAAASAIAVPVGVPVAKVAYAPGPISYAPAPVSYAAPVTKIAYSAPVAKVAYQAPISYAAPVAKVAYAEQDLPANYEFAYSVHDTHTGDIKEQKEVRSGYAVQGSYSLVQPDGVHRIVDYTADKEHGFNAVVRYEGTPIAAPAPAKIAYAAPVAKVAYAPAPVSYAAPVAKVAYQAPISYAAPVAKVAYQAPISYAAPVAKVAYQAPISYAAPVAKVAYAENLGHVTFSSPSVTYHH